MNVTKTRLKAERRALREHLNDLRTKPCADPRYMKILDRANVVLRRLQAELEPERKKLQARLAEVEHQLIELEQAGKQTLPDKLRDWLAALQRGADWGPRFKVRWVSADGRFAIITWPGHTYWSDRMNPRAYKQTEHWLIDLDLWEPKKQDGYQMRQACTRADYEGRLTSNIFEDWKNNCDLVYRK